MAKTERGIVQGLIRHMKANGFAVSAVWDGEERTEPKNKREALKAIFAVDESSLRFSKGGTTMIGTVSTAQWKPIAQPSTLSGMALRGHSSRRSAVQ